MSFTPLRNHTHYSLLKALPTVSELVKKAKDYGYKSLAITDTNNMYGAIEFYKECKKNNIKPIIGVELNIKSHNSYYKIILLAKNYNGYKNLMYIVSMSNLKDKKNRDTYLEYKDLEKIKSERQNLDIIALSAGWDGEIIDLILNKQENAKSLYTNYNKIFDDNFYIEIDSQILDKDNIIKLEKSISFCKENNYKIVATNNTYYLSTTDKEAHKIFIRINSEIDGEEYYNIHFKKDIFDFKNEKDINRIFANCPEAIENSNRIADNIDIELELGKWVFPKIEIKKSYDEDVRELAYQGIKDRGLEETKEVIDRLEYELEVIKNKGFSPYFLVVYDLLRYSKENGILTNIRGSVAGSLTTYLLGITKCNPLVYKLPFERFLNPERPSAPDIDMDYADDRRDDVLNYARSKYGYDNVGQIGTFGTMQARAAVRDVARAMKYPYTVGDRLAKLIPFPKQGFPVFINKSIQEIEDLKKLYSQEDENKSILDMAMAVEGKVRHIGVHAAGTVLSPSQIYEYSPIQYDPKGEGKIITQYDMYSIEEAGLLKFDFLGIRNLSILKTAIDIVKKNKNIEIDIEDIPIDDRKTFELLADGKTIGLFQLNGSGMTKFLKELKPSSIFDINAMVALYRPGPIEIIPEYINRKHGKSPTEYIDDRLRDILDQSFGLITYQDDVMMIAIKLGGYSWLEADKLRKAMGKKIPAEMEEQKSKLLKGLINGGLSENKAKMLWERIEPFAAYGFNKAHAASYGRVAYQTSYMKANYPIEYMTAILINESGDIDKISEIITECKAMNISVLPPHINYSDINFEIIKNDKDIEEIRFGFNTIKNIGENIAEAIVIERNKNGVFKNLEDFIHRVQHKDLNKKSIESLCKCGALDDFAERNTILENIDNILEYHKAVSKDNKNQDSLFGMMVADNNQMRFHLKPASRPATIEEKLSWEKELLGLYVSGFPLDPWREKILARGVDIQKIRDELPDNHNTAIAVIIENIKVTKTKKGDMMALINVRDYSGALEVALFPESYKKLKSQLVLGKPLVFSGKTASRNSEKTFVLDEVRDLK